jgi:hypothetical protein
MIRQQKQNRRVSLFAALALVAFYSMPTTFGQGAITPNYKEAAKHYGKTADESVRAAADCS